MYLSVTGPSTALIPIRRHMKTHTGDTVTMSVPMKAVDRKLASARSLREHLTTCGKPKECEMFCGRLCNLKLLLLQQALSCTLKDTS